MPTCARNNARRGTWDLPPPVKLDSGHITFTVLVWCKTQPWEINFIQKKKDNLVFSYAFFIFKLKNMKEIE